MQAGSDARTGLSLVLGRPGQVPRSVCSESCHPGCRKAPRDGAAICCYDCVPCPEGEISNQTDMENCLKCSDDQWPNLKKDDCIPRTVEFLSYEDTLGATLSCISMFLSVVTVIVLWIFTAHRNTPIVRANNLGLSYILLLSLMLCFLCTLLFIGHPLQITCVLRQTCFGIIFTLVISCILAKTSTVVIAFKATIPGSKWRQWMGSRISNSIVLLCSLPQVMLCITWVIYSPPFQVFNTQSEVGKIIVECNEGSILIFYCVLGYMGFLAAVSLIVAFHARTLPDSFNEAKFITFSMLVFCSVWIAFIPAYLSSKGKGMVAVEVFAILASSTGLFGCIFIPKCYIIFLRPHVNTRQHLMRNHK